MKEFVNAVSGDIKTPKIKAPAPVDQAPSTPMPDQQELQRAAMAEEMKRKKTGRASTNLVDEEDNL